MARLLVLIGLLAATAAPAQSNDRTFCLRSADTKDGRACFAMTEQQHSPSEQARLRAELERLAEAARARASR
jgi:hypothetical protein